jgi:hypothetical protein
MGFRLLALSLALFMAWVGANDIHPTLALHQFAVFTNSFDAGTHFHDKTSGQIREIMIVSTARL